MRRNGGLVLAGCLMAVVATTRAAPPEELRKVHILMAFDTADADLGPSLVSDQKRMTKLWQSTIPSDRCSVTVLSAKKDVTGEKIFDYYKKLRGKVSPKDGLVFYFGGHGAINDKLGHVLKLNSGKDVVRSHIRAAMEECKPGLAVLLTDCCSTKEKWDGNRLTVAWPRPVLADISPVVKQLLFQSRGVVDVTAATEEAAWSDDENGGLFTRSFARMVTKDTKELDANKDGFVTWQEFFPQLQKETQYFFREWTAKMRSRYPDANIRAETQKPHAFFLGKQAAYAVVELQNAKADVLRYKYRWNPKDDYLEWSLKPGEKRVHLILQDGESLPRLEVVREGADTPLMLRSVRWDKDRAPRNVEPFYRIKK
ncbi:MAG: caspase family protein [Gemmataceae bacterium]